MNYICFGHTSWDQFPFKRLLYTFPEDGDFFYVTDSINASNAEREIHPLSFSAINNIDHEHTVAIVTHPLWAHIVNRFSFKYMIALIPSSLFKTENLLLKKWKDALVENADLVCTDSEKMYLDLCFQRDGILLLQGEDTPYGTYRGKYETLLLRDYEFLFQQTIRILMAGLPVKEITALQWILREKYYTHLLKQVGAHETIYFLLAIYQYLLHKKEAKHSLFQSFEQALIAGHTDCLQTHYRFVSAIEAQQNNMEAAVSSYGITALTEQQKQQYTYLLSLMNKGEIPLAQAEIYRLNEDYRSAVSVLANQTGAQTKRILLQIYLQIGQIKKALDIIDPSILSSQKDRKDYHLLSGTVHTMQGERHAAIHSFLKAASYDYEAIAHILELQALDESLEILGREIRSAILTHSQNNK